MTVASSFEPNGLGVGSSSKDGRGPAPDAPATTVGPEPAAAAGRRGEDGSPASEGEPAFGLPPAPVRVPPAAGAPSGRPPGPYEPVAAGGAPVVRGEPAGPSGPIGFLAAGSGRDALAGRGPAGTPAPAGRKGGGTAPRRAAAGRSPDLRSLWSPRSLRSWRWRSWSDGAAGARSAPARRSGPVVFAPGGPSGGPSDEGGDIATQSTILLRPRGLGRLRERDRAAGPRREGRWRARPGRSAPAPDRRRRTKMPGSSRRPPSPRAR